LFVASELLCYSLLNDGKIEIHGWLFIVRLESKAMAVSRNVLVFFVIEKVKLNNAMNFFLQFSKHPIINIYIVMLQVFINKY